MKKDWALMGPAGYSHFGTAYVGHTLQGYAQFTEYPPLNMLIISVLKDFTFIQILFVQSKRTSYYSLYSPGKMLGRQ